MPVKAQLIPIASEIESVWESLEISSSDKCYFSHFLTSRELTKHRLMFSSSNMPFLSLQGVSSTKWKNFLTYLMIL